MRHMARSPLTYLWVSALFEHSKTLKTTGFERGKHRHRQATQEMRQPMRIGRLTELLGVPLNERGGMALKLSIARGRLRRRVR